MTKERAIEVMRRHGAEVLADAREYDDDVDLAAAILLPQWAMEDWKDLYGGQLLAEIGVV